MHRDAPAHRSVLLRPALELLAPRPGGRYLDATVGHGGHAEAVLEASAPDGRLTGIDRDPSALDVAGRRLARFGDRVRLAHGCAADLARLAPGPWDGILLDLGVGSWQLDTPERGFSFRHDGPLDMRMDPTRGEPASALLGRLGEDELADLLRRYGEEPRARRIARAIVRERPFRRTRQLAECVARASGWRGGRTHPATRTFQALRIAVNDELGQLGRALDAALDALAPGGRLVVISFHSLEDRLVKHRLRAAAGIGTPRDERGRPLAPPLGRLLTRRPLSGAELDPDNPRARSARLRAFERTPL